VREFFERVSGEFQDLPVDRLHGSVRRQSRDEPRNAIHGQACVAFTLAKLACQLFAYFGELVDPLPKALVLFIAWVGTAPLHSSRSELSFSLCCRRGMENANVAPGPSLGFAHSRPS